MKVRDTAEYWMKPMYQWELCWCLRDTDPEPEYQERWHYEDPEGNNESACYHHVLSTHLKQFQPSNYKKGQIARTEIKSYSMWGHLVVFAEILSSNQLLWDSFSSLENTHRLLFQWIRVCDTAPQQLDIMQQDKRATWYLLSFCSEDGSFVLEL